MNLHRTKSDWEDYAIELGFDSMRTLLKFYYLDRRFSTVKLGDVLLVSNDRAAQLLRQHGIKLRPRGGAR